MLCTVSVSSSVNGSLDDEAEADESPYEITISSFVDRVCKYICKPIEICALC